MCDGLVDFIVSKVPAFVIMKKVATQISLGICMCVV